MLKKKIGIKNCHYNVPKIVSNIHSPDDVHLVAPILWTILLLERSCKKKVSWISYSKFPGIISCDTIHADAKCMIRVSEYHDITMLNFCTNFLLNKKL